MYCTLNIESWLKLNMHIDSSYLDLLNACILKLVYLTIGKQIFSLNWMMQKIRLFNVGEARRASRRIYI